MCAYHSQSQQSAEPRRPISAFIDCLKVVEAGFKCRCRQRGAIHKQRVGLPPLVKAVDGNGGANGTEMTLASPSRTAMRTPATHGHRKENDCQMMQGARYAITKLRLLAASPRDFLRYFVRVEMATLQWSNRYAM